MFYMPTVVGYKFQSTRPTRGETHVDGQALVYGVILIHSPHAGETSISKRKAYDVIFQSPRPVWARQPVYTSFSFVSTPAI